MTMAYLMPFMFQFANAITPYKRVGSTSARLSNFYRNSAHGALLSGTLDGMAVAECVSIAKSGSLEWNRPGGKSWLLIVCFQGHARLRRAIHCE
jgi:hypothetical protein